MKHLLLVTLLLTSWAAHATRSRMESLGQDPLRGSFYLDDNRNIFRNTADINRFRNFTTFEIGESIDTMEGGYFSEVGDFAWGVYLDRAIYGVNDFLTQANLLGLTVSGAATTTATLADTAKSALDLYFGGDAGIEWGVNVRFGMNNTGSDATKTETTTWGINAGLRTGDFGAYVGYNKDRTLDQGSGIDSDWRSGTITVGGTYMIKDFNVWVQWDGTSLDNELGAGEYENINRIDVGIAQIYEISPTARLNFDLSYQWTKTGDADSDVFSISTSNLPLNMGAEVDATSWLVLRASIKASIFGVSKTKVSVGELDTTHDDANVIEGVSVGAGLNFGKLKIDGNLGVRPATTESCRDRDVNGAVCTSSFSNTNILSLIDSRQLFANAALIYWF